MSKEFSAAMAPHYYENPGAGQCVAASAKIASGGRRESYNGLVLPTLLAILTAASASAHNESPREDGAALYGRYCELCHGTDGSGYAADRAPSLISPSFLETATDELLVDATAYGRPGTPMAAFSSELGGPLEPGEMRAIVAWLRAQRPVAPLALGRETVTGDVLLGSELFRAECARCHGARGEGTSAVSLSNPRFLASASDAFVRHAIREGREGTDMMAYGELLSEDQVAALTAFIRTWAQPLEPPKPAGRASNAGEPLLYPDGPRPAFDLREGRYVAADDVKKALDARARMVLVDARPTSDWITSHIPGAVPIPYYDVGALAESLPRDGTMIIAYCACPHAASNEVVDLLRARGFTATAVLDEGFLVWQERGYPVVPGAPLPSRR
jgi:mono/diheme cytochrome c family protein/rhodanese-related sulfurtransferase